MAKTSVKTISLDSIPRPTRGWGAYADVRNTAVNMKPGAAFEWQNPPLQPHSTASRWHRNDGRRVRVRRVDGKVFVFVEKD